MTTLERKLATIRTISDIKPIEGADLICTYIVDGWQVVSKVNEFLVGSPVVFIEVDSWVPHELAPFLSKGKEPREYKGIKGEKLRTVKLKKTLSQGLILPMSVLPQDQEYCLGGDVTNTLNIIKWEQELPANLRGNAKGTFPTFIPRTDQNRIQNVYPIMYQGKYANETFEVTEKLDGSSITIYKHEGTIGVCSRNIDLKDELDNTFWKAAHESGIIEWLQESTVDNLAFQGELVGPGIQGNSYELDNHTIYLFDIFDIKHQQYLHPAFRRSFFQEHLVFTNIQHTPIVHTSSEIEPLDTMLDNANGSSQLNPKAKREGYVFKSNSNPSRSFKVISNEWLLKSKE